MTKLSAADELERQARRWRVAAQKQSDLGRRVLRQSKKPCAADDPAFRVAIGAAVAYRTVAQALTMRARKLRRPRR